MIADARLVHALMVLDARPCGDVAAARLCAIELLAGDAPTTAGERLVATAVLVHLQGQSGPRPTAADVADLVADLSQGRFESLRRDPSALVQFAAAELADGTLAEAAAGLLRSRMRPAGCSQPMSAGGRPPHVALASLWS